MPNLRRIIAQPTQLGRRADPGDIGGGQGTRALAGAANQISQVALAYADAGRRAQVSEGVASVSRQLAESDQQYQVRLAGVSQADDPVQAIEDLRKEQIARRDEILREARSKIRGQAYQQIFEERTFAIGQRFGLQANERARARGLERIRAQTSTSVETLTDLIDQTDNDDLRGEYLSQIRSTLDEAVASGAITEDRAAQIAIGVEDKLQRSELIATAQQGADEIVDTIQKPEERLRVARERFSGEQRDRVVARIKDRNAEDASLREAEARARFDSAVTAAQAGQLSREAALDLGLPGRELNTVLSVIDQVQIGKGPEAGSELYFRLRAQAENPGTRSAFVDLDLLQLSGQITTSELKELQDLQTRDDPDALDTYSQKVDRALASLDLPSTGAQIGKATDRARGEALQFRRQIEAEKRRREAALGRRLTGPEQDELIDFAIADVVTDAGFFSDSKKPRFTVREDDIDDVPDEAANAIRAEIRADGRFDPNDDDIIRRWYLKKLQRGEL